MPRQAAPPSRLRPPTPRPAGFDAARPMIDNTARSPPIRLCEDPMSPIATIERVYALLHSVIPSKGPHDYGTLATSSADNIACCRSVVLRGFDPHQHQLWINTNVHTNKVDHLRHNPDAEVCLWLARRKIQLRLRAEWRVIDANLAARTANLAALRIQAWQEQPPYAKRMYAWPRPGKPITRQVSRKTLEEAAAQLEEAPPQDFAVLLGTLYHIDAIRLVRPIHERFVHTRPRNTWQTERMTP